MGQKFTVLWRKVGDEGFQYIGSNDKPNKVILQFVKLLFVKNLEIKLHINKQ